MANRMFSLPVTRLNALISSSVTFRSARAPIRCTVAISRSTRLSVTSRSRSASSAASKVTADCGEFGSRRRRCEGDSTAARARHPDTTFGATPANSPGGRPTARIAVSLPISVSIDSRLTFPGTDLISASTEPGSSSSSAPSGAGVASSPIRARIRADAAGPHRAAIVSNHVSSALCSAERTMRVIRAAAGGSIRSSRQCRSSSSRTRSGFRSARATCPASQSVSLSASATEHARKPRRSRTWLRWYSIVLPDHS
jgi:hypothetical protein